MTDLIRRFRGLGVALVVLALSAGAVFAAAPQFSPTSDNEQGVEQPDGADATDDAATEVDEDADADESGDEADTETDGAETEDADTETEDADTETEDATGDAGDTHGALVSEAAQASLDPRFANHGEWVSCVAKLDKTVTSATVDWAQVTEDCVAAAEAKDAAKDAAKAERAAAKAAREAAKAQRATERAKGPVAKDKTKTHGKRAPHG